MKKTWTLNSNADDETGVFGALEGGMLTIHHSVLSTSSPTGTWDLEVYNEAVGAWESVADAAGEFTNPAAGAASGVANFAEPPMGELKVTFTSTSGGTTDAATVVVHQAPRVG